MALGDEIQRIRCLAMSELSAAHDYFVDTQKAWKIVRAVVRYGRKFNFKNIATGSVTTQEELANKSREYVNRQLAEATFQQFVAIFELRTIDLLRVWLLAHPKSLHAKTVTFETVLSAPDKDSISLLVIDKELNELSHRSPREWFKYVQSKVKLGCPNDNEIGRIAEAKASRDILVHNGGIVNKIYVTKSGSFARFQENERLEIPERYHRETWELFRKVIADVFNAAASKA